MKIYELFKDGICIGSPNAFYSGALYEAQQKGAIESKLKDGYEIRESEFPPLEIERAKKYRVFKNGKATSSVADTFEIAEMAAIDLGAANFEKENDGEVNLNIQLLPGYEIKAVTP